MGASERTVYAADSTTGAASALFAGDALAFLAQDGVVHGRMVAPSPLHYALSLSPLTAGAARAAFGAEDVLFPDEAGAASPDGTKVVARGSSIDPPTGILGDLKVLVFDSAGATTPIFTSANRDSTAPSCFRYLPDGSGLTWLQDRAGTVRIVVADLDGKNAHDIAGAELANSGKCPTTWRLR